MNPKKFALAEHFSFSFSSKKRVVSVLCLVLSVSFLGFSLIFTNPLSQKQSWFNASSLHSSLVSWFFPRPALDISSSSDSELQKSSDFLEGNKTESVSVKPHVENVAVTHEDASSSGSSDFEKMVGDYNGNCDIFNGKWVRDQRKPYYHGGSCPYIDLPFDCYANGRPDDDFEKWRWQPNRCEIPSFNGTDFLERLRGKRLVFVGDSLNRNMWQSMVCLLRHDVMNKSRVQVVSGKNEFKAEGLDSFRYEDYNCFVDFVRTPFLVREMSFNSGKGPEMETLRLDLMDETTSKYKEADILVFNTGHWWTHEKPSRGKDYYQEGDHVYPMLNVKEAYMKAITTWAKWVDDNIDSNKTRVIFRGYSVTHFKGVQWNSDGQCYKETEPIHNESYLKQYPSKMKTLESVIKQMKTPVMYLNISKLTDYRKDAHPAIYKMGYQTAEERIAAEKSPDCSHWCLPGVPDAWNELLYASLLMEGWGSSV